MSKGVGGQKKSHINCHDEEGQYVDLQGKQVVTWSLLYSLILWTILLWGGKGKQGLERKRTILAVGCVDSG